MNGLQKNRPGSRELHDRIGIFALAILSALMYWLLPKAGDIWWSDASRHALDGAFLYDLARALPFRHPVQFALDYYRQYPALAIGFYPPLFSLALAGYYAIFGVSEASALACEMTFFFLLAWGVFRLSRRWLGPTAAFAATLLQIGAPGLLFWGRQIMLDIPAYALLIWAAVYFLRYLETSESRPLYTAVILAAAAIYTKYNSAFFVGVFALTLLIARGRKAISDRQLWRATGFAVVLVIPAVTIFLVLARFNLAQAANGSLSGSSDSLFYYLDALPQIMSWSTVLLALSYSVGSVYLPSLRLQRSDGVFLVTWLIVGFVFYTAIAVKDPRHIIFVTYPIALAPILLIERLPISAAWGRRFAGLALGLVTFTFSLLEGPAPFVAGPKSAAISVAELSPPNTNVAFWGRHDGTFVFAMRCCTGRPDLGVVRLDKILFNDAAVYLERAKSQSLSGSQITDAIAGLHAQYVVFQEGYLASEPSVRALQQELQSNRFKFVRTIKMSSNYPFSNITRLDIYRLARNVPHTRASKPIEIRIIGITL